MLMKCERIAGGFICGRTTVKSRPYKGKTPQKPKLVLAVGRIYLVRRYYTGDFRAKCCESRFQSVRLKVTDPMKTSLQVDDELEIPFVHAEFIPALVEEFKKPIAEREFNRYRIGEGPRSAI
jgi:hypothetical protein